MVNLNDIALFTAGIKHLTKTEKNVLLFLMGMRTHIYIPCTDTHTHMFVCMQAI